MKTNMSRDKKLINTERLFIPYEQKNKITLSLYAVFGIVLLIMSIIIGYIIYPPLAIISFGMVSIPVIALIVITIKIWRK